MVEAPLLLLTSQGGLNTATVRAHGHKLLALDPERPLLLIVQPMARTVARVSQGHGRKLGARANAIHDASSLSLPRDAKPLLTGKPHRSQNLYC
ncbi:uncharacterized protein K460DRAFT_371690 [Cucurbitaria berberidis CBS 394.84]|uniref:Uncharacterized protein n=1 Tax=Cucurbitaria berberidis CBS 394.84 TaxID=1168544 RepID=A0A9P4L341_9PLEO|nr:uncharacterized protein K460DRAFT_371690 [Cucurbitaria berberidis CBS 394.84]KAF1840501.1 hypothetical protein K460DRAFT_371690 [Cucurbitaria berberidis CBS 394.84]